MYEQIIYIYIYLHSIHVNNVNRKHTYMYIFISIVKYDHIVSFVVPILGLKANMKSKHMRVETPSKHTVHVLKTNPLVI